MRKVNAYQAPGNESGGILTILSFGKSGLNCNIQTKVDVYPL